MKKFLCLLLTAMMLLTSAVILPVSADGAGEPAETPVVDYQAPVFYGVQAGNATETTQDIRFVSVVPNSNGTAIGYEIYAKFNDGGKYIEYSVENDTKLETDTVYSSLEATKFERITTDAAAEELGMENAYGLMALAITGVPTNIGKIYFYVRTYVKEVDEVKAEKIETGFIVNGVLSDETVAKDTAWTNQGGIGTAEYPYVITQANFAAFYNAYPTKERLNGPAFGKDSAGNQLYYSLESDVELFTSTASSWVDGLPNGYFTNPLGKFQGIFNGNNHTISGFCLKSTIGTAALFSILDGGTITNLRVTNSWFEINSTAYDDAATFAGRIRGGTIENCYSDAIVNVTNTSNANQAVGGFVGNADAAGNKFINCVFAGVVNGGSSRAGGILGKGDGKKEARFTNCLNLGSVAGKKAGAIVGHNDNDYTQYYFTNCINLSTEINSAGAISNNIIGYGPWNIGKPSTTYVVSEFSTGNGFGPAGKAQATITEVTLKQFFALDGTLEGWYFKEGCVPCPIKGLEIAIPAEWSSYLN